MDVDTGNLPHHGHERWGRSGECGLRRTSPGTGRLAPRRERRQDDRVRDAWSRPVESPSWVKATGAPSAARSFRAPPESGGRSGRRSRAGEVGLRQRGSRRRLPRSDAEAGGRSDVDLLEFRIPPLSRRQAQRGSAGVPSWRPPARRGGHPGSGETAFGQPPGAGAPKSAAALEGRFRCGWRSSHPCPRVEFVATDAEADLLDGYREAALRYATRSGLDRVGADRGRLRLEGACADARRIEVSFGTASVPKPPPAGPFDVLLAQSFWDLLPPGSAPAYARRVLVPDGLFLATLTFDGEDSLRAEPPLRRADAGVLSPQHGR